MAGLVAVSVALAAGAQTSAASKTKPRKPKRQSTSLLYALNAAHGTLRHGAHGHLVLRLRGLERRGVWFADPPAPSSSSFPSAAFASSWKGFGFAADPPDAALQYTRAGRQRTAMLKLSHPRSVKHHRVLSFRARLLDPDKVKDPNLASHARAADRKPAHRFAAPSLFIADDVPVVNGCTITWYTRCPGADLSYVNLSHANLSHADLKDANFTGSDLGEVNFLWADLEGANLTDVQAPFANFKDADLTNANLTDAYVDQAEFTDANLSGANLTGAFGSQINYRGALFCNTTMPDGSFNPGDCPS